MEEEKKERELIKPKETADDFFKSKLDRLKLSSLEMRSLTADVASDVYGRLSDPEFYDDVVFFIKAKNIVKELGLSDGKRGFDGIDDLYRTLDEFCERISLLEPDELYGKDAGLSRKKAGDVWLYFMLVGAYVFLRLKGEISDDEYGKLELCGARVAMQAKQDQGRPLSQVL